MHFIDAFYDKLKVDSEHVIIIDSALMDSNFINDDTVLNNIAGQVIKD